jgi:plastocyanin
MSNIIQNRTFINLFNLLIVLPLLWALSVDKFPNEYKKYIVWLVVILALYYIYELYVYNVKEGMCISGSNVVQLKLFDSSPGYDQPMLTINRGTVVVWTNVGEVQHTVTSDTGAFNSGIMMPGDSYSVKFTEPGYFFYHSEPDKGWMTGVVIVQ